MDKIALDFGFIQIYWYSIFIYLGVLVATYIIFREAKKQKVNLPFMTNLIFYTVIFGIIGARLYYCLFNYNYYSAHPMEILEIWNGGLAIHGGIIFGFLWILFYTKKYKVSTKKILDISVSGVIIGQAIGRWGNFFNHEAYGKEVTRAALENMKLPDFIVDGMNINGTYYQPTFFYESIWNLTGFFVLLIVKRYKYLKTGQLTGVYLMWYSFGRFFIESLRSDSLMLGNIRIAQLASILLFGIGLLLLLLGRRGSKLI